jgi:hypothetical protein
MPRSCGDVGRSPSSADRYPGYFDVASGENPGATASREFVPRGGVPDEVVGVVDRPAVAGEPGPQLPDALGGVAQREERVVLDRTSARELEGRLLLASRLRFQSCSASGRGLDSS